MKKSLSFLVALALVFGLFASMAAAADSDLTTAQKYQQLVDNKVLKGTTDGDAHLSDNLTRAEFATIAVAIAGLQEDTTSTPAFSDVKAGQWWTGAIQAAYNAGLVNGVGNGMFSPKADVTVQEIIKVAVGIAKLTPVADATVEGAADWAGPYIKAAQDAGLPVPTNFKAAATRGQTVDLAYAVYLASQVKPLDEVKAAVNADDTITVTGKTAGGVDGVKVAVGTADAAAATLNADGTFTYTTAKQAVGSYDLTVTAYKGETSVSTAKVSATIDGFTVDSVNVLNGKQVAITFNKAVQAGIADGGASHGTTGNFYYALAGQTAQRVALSDDGKTVTVTFNKFSDVGLDRYAQLTVSGSLKSASGQSLSAYKQAVLLSDSTAPTVSGVTYAGTQATISFSEPIKTLATNHTAIAVNGSNITTGTAINYSETTDDEGDVTAIVISGLAQSTSYSFYLINGVDTAGNAFDYNTTLMIPSDTSYPTVASVTVDGSKIKVKYSEALSAYGHVYPQNISGLSTATQELSSSYDSSTYTVTYDVSNWLTFGGNSYNFLNPQIKIEGYTDLVNLTGVPSYQNVTISKDTTNPTVVSAIYDGTYLAIQFSEELSSVTTGANISYKYTNTNSVVTYGNFALTSATVGYDLNNDGDVNDSNEKNYIKVPETLGNGTYALTSIPGSVVKDTSSRGNDSGSASLTISSSNTSGNIRATITSPSNGRLQFVFKNSAGNLINMATADLDPAKFLINGTALPEDTNIYFLTNQSTVVADLPAGAVPVTGYRTVKVVDVVDDSGNTLDTSNSNFYQASIQLTENVKPVAQTVTLLNDHDIAVNFSETLGTLPSLANAGLTVYVNGTEITVNSISKNNNVLTIHTNTSTFNATQTISVKIASSSIVDMVGNTVADVTVNK